MANVENWLFVTSSTEGGEANHSADMGKYTNMGVTEDTWRHKGWDINKDGKIDNADLKLLDKAGVARIVYGTFWKPIYDKYFQPIADVLADGKWGSGKFYQWNDQFMAYLLNGAAINAYPDEIQRAIAIYVHAWRVQYVRGLIVDTYGNVSSTYPDQGVFERGWMLKHISYGIRTLTGVWHSHSRYDANMKSAPWKFYAQHVVNYLKKKVYAVKEVWFIK